MPSSTNNANNLTRNASFPCRMGTSGGGGGGGYEEHSSDVQNNSQASAFSRGIKGRQAPLDSGRSDDSDLPRLSPIRTSSGTALNCLERKPKQTTLVRREGQGLGRCPLSRSSFYEEQLYKPSGTLYANGGQDSSDLSCFVGSHEESLTATSGACSALSEDVWQSSPPSEQMTKTPNEAASQELEHESDNAAGQHLKSKSNIGSFFDNLTTTLNRSLQTLAIKVERATTTAARELTSTMRYSTETRPDAAFFEIHDESSGCHAVKVDKAFSPDSDVSTAIATGRNPHVRTISYDTSFNMCGGQDLYEELESLCNEYAKKLNKLRSCLSDVDKSRLDGLLTRLYPVFDVVGSPSESDDEGDVRSVDERLSHLYMPIDMMVAQSMSTAAQKERSSVLEIANLVANPVNVLGSASQIPLTPQTSRCAELFVELESAVDHGRYSAELIHEDGIRRVAELSTSCINCLLELANDLILPPESHERVEWPSGGVEMGLLLRSFIIRLVHNLEAVTGSFVGALLGVGSAYDENLQDCSVGQKAQGLACDMELDSGTAVTKVQESLRNLMYVVVYVTFES